MRGAVDGQRVLFDLDEDRARSGNETAKGLGSETPTQYLQRDRDSSRHRLFTFVDRNHSADDPIEVARLAMQTREVAEHLVASSVREAIRAGSTWRAVGAALGIPSRRSTAGTAEADSCVTWATAARR